MDLKSYVVMLNMRVKRRGYFVRECRALRNQGNRNRDAPTRNTPVDTSTTNSMVVQDGICDYDWSFQAEEELTNFALMYDQKREALNKSNLEIIGYLRLESLEARILVHEKNEAVYEEDIALLKYDVQVKDISIKDFNNQLENALKEKDDLKLKLEKINTSSMNLTKLINSQISAIDKTGLGYDGHVNESEVFNNVVDSCESDRDDNQVNDRFKKGEGYHAVLPPYTGNYMPPRADLSFTGLDNSIFKSKVSKTITSVPKIETNASKTCKDSLEKPKTVRNTTIENENKAEKPRKFSQSPRVLIKSGQVPVNDAKQSSHRATTSVSTARHVNIVVSRPNVHNALPTTYSYFNAHSPIRRPFNKKSAAKTNNFNEKINTAKGNPQYALQDQRIFNSGCFRHITRNKSYLTDYQEIDGGFVTFGGNAKGGKITGKDPGRERAQRNEFESMFGQDKDANGNRMFTPVSAAGSTYVNLGGSIPINAATLPNADLPTGPLMPDLEDTADLQDTGIFSGAYDDEVADFNNLKLTTVVSPIPTTMIHKDHPKEQIIGDPLSAPQTRIITKTSKEHAMVDLPKRKHDIGTKWVYINKKDKRGIVVRNKARLVAQGYTQEEGIDYDEVFTPVARIEAIRLFLAYASFMRFIVYQMNEKSVFLYGTVEGEMYVCQPLGFEDPYFPDKVYKVEKALYGLHQAPRAWYKTMSTYLLENIFKRRIIDKTLFIKKDKGDLLLMQVYVDDIIFGSTKKSLCTEFEGLMYKKFQMSSMGELTFFLGLQVMQRDDGIFISQDKYVADLLKKFDFSSVKTTSTLIETNKALLNDEEAVDVDIYLYRSMIGSLMYLTAVRIFRYLKCQPKLGLWSFDLEAFLDSDYVGASLDRKSITGVYTSCIKQFWATAKVKNVNGEAHIQAIVDKKKVIIIDASIRRDLRFEDEGGVDCLSNEVIFEQLTVMGAKTIAWNEFSSTMASAIICLAINKNFNFSKYIFDNMVKHFDGGVKFMIYPIFVQVFLDNQVEGMDRHNANFVIFSHTKKVFANIKREGKDFSGKVTPLFQSMMKKKKSNRKQRKEIEVPSPNSEIPNEERLPTTSNDPLPSGEDRMRLLVQEESQEIETEKAVKNLGLKRLRKVGSARKVESSTKASLGDQDDASKYGRIIDNIDQDVEITLVDDTQGRMNEEDMWWDELTLAQTLIEIQAAKPKGITTAATIVTAAGTSPKAKGIVRQELSERPTPTPTDSSQQSSKTKDKGKAKMIESEKPLKRKERIMIDEEEEEANIALAAKWDNTQAMMDADCELAARLQEEKRGELSIEEKSRLFVELMVKRNKHFARLRAKNIRSKPPTKAQKRNHMCTYLKNMANYKHNQLKNKSFKEIQMLFNNTMKWIEAFVPMNTEKTTEGGEKITEEENESAKLKRCLEIIPEDDEDVTIEATPLSSKSPTIVDYKIYRQRRKSFFKIIKVDGNSQNYLTFGKMLKNFNREDLEVLWSIVKARFKKTTPIDDMDNMLF
nr:putative ribonuclease H-like domain-containing protein [Tanacetum cinerariifolium]